MARTSTRRGGAPRPPDDLLRACIEWMFEEYGPQGWWPIRSECADAAAHRDPRWARGYHPGHFDHPKTRAGRWEVVAGAVLTQNTAWWNVEQALGALGKAGLHAPEALTRLAHDELATLIRPAGYFNQKARYLLALAEWFVESDATLSQGPRTSSAVEQVRPSLLAVRGVGPETADSILLYAYSLPTFVIDAYTRRIFERLGAVAPDTRYEALRTTFETALGRSSDRLEVECWQEAHALIVEHAKQHHGAGRDGTGDPLRSLRKQRRAKSE